MNGIMKQSTQKQEQSCDHSGCWLGFLKKEPEFFDGKQTHQGEHHNVS